MQVRNWLMRLPLPFLLRHIRAKVKGDCVAGSREGTPSRWLPGGSKPPMLDNCPICREPRPKKIKQGGTRCETTTPLRDKDGSIMYDKEGTAVTAQCPHVFVPPPSVSRDKDGEELATVSGQKQPLRQPDPFFHRLPKVKVLPTPAMFHAIVHLKSFWRVGTHYL